MESRRNDIPENIESQCQPGSRTSEARVFDELKPSVDSTESSVANCESCDKNRGASSIGDTRPHITVKSFDMPNIDCDDQEVQPVVIKQEADDSCYEICYDSQCEPTSTSERLRPQEPTKRHSLEKSHPGIENVVEKLKKNAAALQDAAPPTPKTDESADRPTEGAKPRRHYETIPKKLHILRSCASSLETVDAEVSSSQISSDQCPQTQSGRYSPQVEDDSKCDSSKECLLSDNNNDSRSDNNNIKALMDKRLFVKNERTLFDVTGHVKPKTIWSCEMPAEELHATRKPDLVAEDAPPEARSGITKEKPSDVSFDVSGLELLSKSIEQLEQGIGQSKHPQLEANADELPIDNSKLLGQQSENNNNKVNNFVFLCALAGETLQNMEEVNDEITESSEEISHAGRLLMNLGRNAHVEKSKRKCPETDDHQSKRFKLDERAEVEEGYEENEVGERASLDYYEEDATSMTIETPGRLKEKTRLDLRDRVERVGDLSMENTDNDVDEEEEEERQSLHGDIENRYANKLAFAENLQVTPNETDNSRRHDVCYESNAKDGTLSDANDEVFEPNSPSGQSSSYNGTENKRQTSIEERDYKNTRAKLEARKLAGRKDGDWPNMNATELDMRAQMAELQKQYYEKRKELGELEKLIPRKDDKRSPGRPRKKSHSSG